MQNTAMISAVDTDSVRLKAYELWVSGGRREGVAVQNWLEAERILRSTEASVATYKAPVNVAPVVSAAAADISIETKASTHAVPPSTPPLGLTDLSATNKQNKTPVTKGGAGRKR